jgi:hypothetical protein
MERGIGVDKVSTSRRGITTLRETRTDEDTKRGDAFARPDAVSGVIPAAVDVADYVKY